MRASCFRFNSTDGVLDVDDGWDVSRVGTAGFVPHPVVSDTRCDASKKVLTKLNRISMCYDIRSTQSTNATQSKRFFSMISLQRTTNTVSGTIKTTLSEV